MNREDQNWPNYWQQPSETRLHAYQRVEPIKIILDTPHTPTHEELEYAFTGPSPDIAAFDRADLWPEGGDR